MSDSKEFGKWISKPPIGEEVVITGISGRFPESHNVQEYQENLFNKVDMVTDDDKRWKLQKLEIPQKSGKIYDIDKLDAGYFGLHYRQADIMTPMMRKLLEISVETIMDAGINPTELVGSKTGVYVGLCYSDMEIETLTSITKPQSFGITGYLRSVLANRVSYFLKLKGPSYTVDTACSSSFNALELAFKSIRTGQCENALVAGVNLVLQPGISRQYFRLGMLSSEGKCKVFDQTADGLVRGETTACVFLQKSKNSRRIYAEIVHSKINSDGFKTAGITFPSSEMQEVLMRETLDESGTQPNAISFMEAHSTGTQVGDPQECNAIDCAIAKKRTKPLLVGSVKCSVGHSEAASGLCSLVKVIIAMETGLIAPNINLNKIKEEMLGFHEGRMKVVTELTELEGNDAIVAINNFGFGGTNCHLIVKRFKKLKDNKALNQDDLPRLVCISARTEAAAKKLLEKINECKFDPEYTGLLHQVFKADISGHFYRGFTILSKAGPIKTEFRRVIKKKQKPLQVIFDNFENSYTFWGQHLMKYSSFQATIKRINDLMGDKVRVLDVVNGKQNLLDIFAVQLGVVEILNLLELDFTVIFNNFLGKLVSDCHNKNITLEDAIEAISKNVEKVNNGTGFDTILPKLGKISQMRFKQYFAHTDSTNPCAPNSVIYQNTPIKPEDSIVLNLSNKMLKGNGVTLFGKNSDTLFLDILGRLYQEGYNPQLHKLYSPIQYPVSRTTPMISPLIQWDYSKTWTIPRNDEFTGFYITQQEHIIDLDLHDEQRYITGHVIDGRNLLPATEYLQLVWKTFVQNYNMCEVDSLPIVFENCRFIRAVTISKNVPVKILVSIQKGSGYFEILEKESLLVAGRVYSPTNIEEHQRDLPNYVIDENRENYLDQDEIYRELNLRGYNYSGFFKGIAKCNVDVSAALIKWESNWTTFMDKMLQLKILQTDTRSLYVPVRIKKLSINVIKHIIFTKKATNSLCPAYAYKDCNVIKSGGIEICGLQAASITKKKSTSSPVLEKHVFVPNNMEATLEQSARILVQIILENSLEHNFNAVEILNDFSKPNSDLLMPLISKALDDVPATIANLTISSKTEVDTIPEITVKDLALTSTDKLLLIIATNALGNFTFLNQILGALCPNGFILTREDISFVPEGDKYYQILNEHIIGDEKLILIRKTKQQMKSEFIEVESNNFDWISKLQNARKNKGNIVIFSQNQNPEGLLGFINCIRRESRGHEVCCFLMMDKAPKFEEKNLFYQKQLNKQMAINVYKDNKWGTYRHLVLNDMSVSRGQHFFVNNTVKGDLSSLKWLEGWLNSQTKLDKGSVLVFPVYSALNFKDVVLASGRVSIDAVTTKRIEQDCAIGFEFCGYDINGRRVMGMVNSRALATAVVADSNFLWQVPKNWSLEDASTVICVYATVLYALTKVIALKPGMSILIHSATGGIGLAALNVCFFHGCKVFVTVGTQEKKDFLKKHYPQIPESHIGNSRDLSFEEMIKIQTNGNGVDVVLNSLSEDKLRASIRCMASDGNFLEIGKFDLGNDASLNLLLLQKNVNYHGIMLDHILTQSPETKNWIFNKINEGIKLGYVKPLPKTIFQRNEIVEAFKYMMTGKHIGKVVVQIRDINCKDAASEVFQGCPRFSCNPGNCYVILGGLGGIGLELADWLYIRGAKKLVLVSRQGIQSGYQKQRIRNWKSNGVSVRISTDDITTEEGCFDLIKEANKLGPVEGIFNLAVVLKDALFEDQTEETFKESLAPKAKATIYLDQITRELCPEIKYFVVFSSVSCGRGNAGQTNYGMANSIMERICERRKEEGLPGLAIQWGAIGDVGLVAKMQKDNKDLVIGGTLQQKISSCLEVLDTLLKQDLPVVSSIVVAEKVRKTTGSAVDAVAYILGIKDVKAVRLDVTFAELGMDSMMGTETIQILEKDFDIYLTAKEMRNMTFAKLMELEVVQKKNEGVADKAERGTNILLNHIPRVEVDDVQVVKLLSNVKNEESAITVFVMPGIEGVFENMELLVSKLEANVFGIEYGYRSNTKSVEEYAKAILPHVEEIVSKQGTFHIIAYSFGTVVAAELTILLERKGFTGCLMNIEGSPAYLLASLKENFSFDSEEELEISLLFKILSLVVPINSLSGQKDKFLRCANFDERFELAVSQIPSDVIKKHKFKKQGMIALHNRTKLLINYKFNKEKIKSRVHLFKAKFPIISDFADDYQLSDLCQEPVQVTSVDGDHVTILNQDQLINSIREIIKV